MSSVEGKRLYEALAIQVRGLMSDHRTEDGKLHSYVLRAARLSNSLRMLIGFKPDGNEVYRNAGRVSSGVYPEALSVLCQPVKNCDHHVDLCRSSSLAVFRFGIDAETVGHQNLACAARRRNMRGDR